MKRALLAAAIILILHNAALVHSWYPSECCSGQDCRPVPCESLTENEKGWLYEPLKLQFAKSEQKVSQDRFCHVCYGETTDEEGNVHYNTHCVYILPTA